MSFLDKAKKAAYDLTTQVAEKVRRPPTVSCFREKGFLTPEEFVAAGDALVHKCQTWQWASGDPSKASPYLPKDKQFLITRNVACRRRARALKSSMTETDAEDGWIETHDIQANTSADVDVADMGSLSIGEVGGASATAAAQSQLENMDFDDEDIPDMDDVDDEEAIEQPDPAALCRGGSGDLGDDIVLTRTYDLSITYDNFHWTPRVWLFGYDEQHRPLKPESMLEDMSQDHAERTVTIDPHPHLQDVAHVSIHPCRHAEVMLRLTQMISSGGREMRPDQSVFLFLKFISSAIPTIEYDYTMEIDM